MEKSLINSDTINDNDHIYFNLKGNFFEMIVFKIGSDLIKSIIDGVKALKEKGYTSDIIFIPFVKYNNFIATKDNIYPWAEMLSLDEIIKQLYGAELSIIVMIPDELKDKCKPLNV